MIGIFVLLGRHCLIYCQTRGVRNEKYITLDAPLDVTSMLPNHSHSKRSAQGCVCVSLVKLWLLVKKIEYRQAFLRRVIFSPDDLEN